MEKFAPSLVFLSEPQTFQCDIRNVTLDMFPLYNFYLNSEDIFDQSLALEKSRAKGGTMLLWPSSLDPYVTILPTTSPAILPAMVKMRGCITSYHIGIYLPTRVSTLPTKVQISVQNPVQAQIKLVQYSKGSVKLTISKQQFF